MRLLSQRKQPHVFYYHVSDALTVRTHILLHYKVLSLYVVDLDYYADVLVVGIVVDLGYVPVFFTEICMNMQISFPPMIRAIHLL